jgi:hypothetical protein
VGSQNFRDHWLGWMDGWESAWLALSASKGRATNVLLSQTGITVGAAFMYLKPRSTPPRKL